MLQHKVRGILSLNISQSDPDRTEIYFFPLSACAAGLLASVGPGLRVVLSNEPNV
jgi:hypothetical protein